MKSVDNTQLMTTPTPSQPRNPLHGKTLESIVTELGLCSRREADDWIAQGWVKVNGKVAEMGVQVLPTDRIEVDKVAQGFQEQRVTILLHKPIGYVSGQAEDGHTPAVALINPRTHWRDDPSRNRFSPPQLRGLHRPGGSILTRLACWCSRRTDASRAS